MNPVCGRIGFRDDPSIALVEESMFKQLDKIPFVEPSVSDAAPTDAVNRSLHVLVVDDDDDNAEIVAEVLSDFGLTVRVARNGAAALDAMAKAPADVVCLDMELPDMDGCEVARRIRALGATSTRIVALTGYNLVRMRDAALAAGCDVFLVKPFRLEQLRAVIDASPVQETP